MDKAYGIIMAIAVGMSLGLQPPINAALGKVVSPKIAAFHSLLTSATIMGIIIIFSGNFKQYSNIKNVSPIYWIGGVFGACIVFFSVKVIPILGTASALSIFVSVQIIIGAVVNHFGVLGVTKSPIDLIRFIGIILVLIGVKMIVR